MASLKVDINYFNCEFSSYMLLQVVDCLNSEYLPNTRHPQTPAEIRI